MPTVTYTPLANITLSSTVTSLTFSSISQAYRDLVLIATPLGSTSSSSIGLTMNGVTSSTYSRTLLEANGSSILSNAGTSTSIYWTNNYSDFGTVAAPLIINIMDYSATDKHKNVLIRSNNANAEVSMATGRWASTAAVTSFKLDVSAGASGYIAGSTFELFGIVA